MTQNRKKTIMKESGGEICGAACVQLGNTHFVSALTLAIYACAFK